ISGSKKSSKKKAKQMAPQEKKLNRGMEKNFLLLCRWGKKRGQPYQTGITPQEYCDILATAFPRWKGEFQGLGKIFEKHFYSSHRLTNKEMDPIEPWLRGLEKRRTK
ncbi:MAG: DUF4129 domain-containing protein, partial [Spirochaetaceae bacterium]|nr:DUF4129 domain-containing protein [Spirochaetaceae bacterium]